MDHEYHLFIIWQRGRNKEKDIINDISNKFSIIEIYENTWDNEFFSNNMTRFYGVKLPDGSFKEKECGTGSFLIIIVKDFNAQYSDRATSRGHEDVNHKMFDSKELYRKWTGGGHKIHGTNNTDETNHDLTLLFGKNLTDFTNNIEKTKTWDGIYKKISKNIVGYNGWRTIEQLFYVLNATINYIVLRNYECLPEEYNLNEHGDIDLLTDSYDDLKFISNSKKVYNKKYRVHHHIEINNELIPFDFRLVGDSYYPIEMEKKFLENKKENKGLFFIPSEEHYFYSLLYHALVHKKEISDDYYFRLEKKFNHLICGQPNPFTEKDKKQMAFVLDDYMKKNNFSYTEPNDLSVFYNLINPSLKISTKRKLYNLRFLPVIQFLKNFLKSTITYNH